MLVEREFYLRDGLTVARELIGKRLVHRTPEGVTAGIIVETEAYIGPDDAAAHSCRGKRTGRTAVMYGPGGFAYVYLIYGMHCCFNVVANREEYPEAVLIRALEPTEGIDLMCRRRNQTGRKALCGGPGKLCQAMAITRAQYGSDLCGDALYVEDGIAPAPAIVADRRINVAYAGAAAEYPWRFLLRDSPYVSVPPGSAAMMQ